MNGRRITRATSRQCIDLNASKSISASDLDVKPSLSSKEDPEPLTATSNIQQTARQTQCRSRARRRTPSGCQMAVDAAAAAVGAQNGCEVVQAMLASHSENRKHRAQADASDDSGESSLAASCAHAGASVKVAAPRRLGSRARSTRASGASAAPINQLELEQSMQVDGHQCAPDTRNAGPLVPDRNNPPLDVDVTSKSTRKRPASSATGTCECGDLKEAKKELDAPKEDLKELDGKQNKKRPQTTRNTPVLPLELPPPGPLAVDCPPGVFVGAHMSIAGVLRSLPHIHTWHSLSHTRFQLILGYAIHINLIKLF